MLCVFSPINHSIEYRTVNIFPRFSMLCGNGHDFLFRVSKWTAVNTMVAATSPVESLRIS